MQRETRFSFLQSVLMQRGAHFLDEIAFPCRWRSFFAISPSKFSYVTFVFALFYNEFAMLPSNFQGKLKDFIMLPPVLLCFITGFAMPPSNS